MKKNKTKSKRDKQKQIIKEIIMKNQYYIVIVILAT